MLNRQKSLKHYPFRDRRKNTGKMSFTLICCLLFVFSYSQCVDKLEKGIQGYSFLQMNEELLENNRYHKFENEKQDQIPGSYETSGKSNKIIQIKRNFTSL